MTRAFIEALVYVNSIEKVFVYVSLDKDFRHFVLTILTLGLKNSNEDKKVTKCEVKEKQYVLRHKCQN